MKGMQQFIINIRHSKTPVEENNRASDELLQIRRQFNEFVLSNNNSIESTYQIKNMRKYLCELIYIFNLGIKIAIEDRLVVSVCLKLIDYDNLGRQNEESNNIGEVNIRDNHNIDDEEGYGVNSHKRIPFLVLKLMYSGKLNDTDVSKLLRGPRSNLQWYELQDLYDVVGNNPALIKEIIPLLWKINEDVDIRIFSIFREYIRVTSHFDELDYQVKFNLVFVNYDICNKAQLSLILHIFKESFLINPENKERFKNIIISKFDECLIVIKKDGFKQSLLHYSELLETFCLVLEDLKLDPALMLENMKYLLDQCVINEDEELITYNLFCKCLNYYASLGGYDILLYLIGFLKRSNDINVKISILEQLEEKVDLFDYNICHDFKLFLKLFTEKNNEESRYLIFKILSKSLVKGNSKIPEIKDSIKLFILFLDKTSNNEFKNEIINSILDVLDIYKDSTNIIEISIFKILKKFLIYGQYNNTSWEILYNILISTKGIEKHLNQLLEFLQKCLSINCCENFIKLSAFLCLFNLKNYQMGNLATQVILFIKKYEHSSNLVVKLIMLDLFFEYYSFINDENLKLDILEIFTIESNNENLQIRQHSCEYLKIIKIPDIFSKLSMTRPCHFDGDYYRLMKFDQGILKNHVKFKISRVEKGKVTLELNHKEEFHVQILDESTENYHITVSDVEANKKILSCDILNICNEVREPEIKLVFGSEEYQLKLGLCLKSLHKGTDMNIEQFNKRWNLIRKNGYKISMSTNLLGILRTLQKLNFNIVSSGEYIHCCGILNVGSKAIGCLAFLSDQGIEVRCTADLKSSKFICERLYNLSK